MLTIAFDHPYHGPVTEQFGTRREALDWAVRQEHTNQCADIRCDITNMAEEGYTLAAVGYLYSATDELHFLDAVTAVCGDVTREEIDEDESEWWENAKPYSRKCVACGAISHGDYDHIPWSCVSCGEADLRELD
jgi:hypothetical protein